MATSLNAGYTNNINVVQVRANGAHSQRLTDRTIDFDGDGNKEAVTIVHESGHAVGVPSAPGGKIRSTTTVPDGFARTVIQRVVETDNGVNSDEAVSEFTEGIE